MRTVETSVSERTWWRHATLASYVGQLDPRSRRAKPSRSCSARPTCAHVGPAKSGLRRAGRGSRTACRSSPAARLSPGAALISPPLRPGWYSAGVCRHPSTQSLRRRILAPAVSFPLCFCRKIDDHPTEEAPELHFTRANNFDGG